MAGKHTWKLIVTFVAVLWAVLNITPPFDTKFQDFVEKRAEPSPENQTKWRDLLAKAKTRVDEKQDKTFYLALRNAANAEQADLATFFPFIQVEEAMNVRKKNKIVLDGLLRRSRGQIQTGLDLSGGVAFTLEVDRPAGSPQSQDELQDAIKIITERIDALGVAEPIVRPVGENRIVVQIAGDPSENPDIVDVVKKPARLEFRLVHPTARPEFTPPDEVPDYEEMILEDERQGKTYSERLYVKRKAEMTGKLVERAVALPDQFGQPYIQLQFKSEGAKRFGQITTDMEPMSQQLERAGMPRQRLAIVLDGVLQSAPTVNEPITGGTASISGKFTDREAIELQNVLNNPLDLPLRVVETNVIGPTLAKDAVSSGTKAFIIGTAITVAFIAVYYTSAGLLAVLAMAINVLIILGVMCSDSVNATLSMPGIAGIVLTIAMSVDSNILIFERMREELAIGKNLRASLEAGFEKAFSAIFDGNVTTLITALIMIFYGTGPVKGFGVTLTIGIFSTMFAALVVSRLFLEVMVFSAGVQKIKFLSVIPETKFDFMKWAKPAFIASWTIVLLGVVTMAIKGSDVFGIDFKGGDELSITFERRLDLTQIDAAARAVNLSDISRSYQAPLGGGTETLKVVTPFEKGDTLLAKLQEMYPDAGLKSAGAVKIGGSVSSEITWNAFIAIGLSLVGILLYVAFRFEMGYGIGAVISTIHDVFMTIGMYVLLGGQFNAAMVGAILLIVGYSINDTIVVFDRIREELHLNPNIRLREIINLSLNKTLARTIITGGTTFLTAITLTIVATGDVHDISVTLIVGIITGTFSSLFVASPIFYWWHKGDRKHVEESHDITPKYEWAASSKAAE